MFSKHLIEIFVMLAGSFVLGYMWRGVAKQSGDVSVPATKKSTSDDLMAIFGVTPKANEALHDAGIYTYRQLAATSKARIEEILEENDIKKVNGSEWPREAAQLAKSR